MKHLKLFFALFAMLALGVTNAWAEGLYFEGFEENHRTSGNNSYTADAKTYGDWTLTYADAVTSGSPLTGTAYVIMRVAKNTTNSPSLVSKELLSDKVSITKVSWNCKGNTAQTLKVSYSTDGSNWVEKYSAKLTTSKTNKSFTLDNVPGPIYLKFVVSVASSTSGNRDANIDDITMEGTALSTEETYSVTLNQPSEGGTIEADKDEAAEGATVTLTATPDEGYKFDSWSVTGTSGNIAVTNNQFTMPASNVTVSASFVAKTQYTIKWNVAEGSVDDTKVYEGDALGTLPTADNCSSGKVFVGWTEANSVNADGSDITYAKSTDVPAGDKEYNAVYATEITTGGGGATKYVKATTISDGTYLIAATNGANSYAYTGQVTGKTYGGYTSVTISDDEIATKPDAALEVTVKVTDGKFSMHDGTSYLYLSSNDNNLNFATTEKTDWMLDNGKIKNAAITASTRYLQFNSASGSERFACYKSTQKDAYLYKKGDGSSTSYTDYSLDCEANNEPFLTVTETAFDFGTVAQNETATETFDVTGGYLAEDVALTISGANASFFSVNPTTIAKADEVNETVTVTYNPTEVGDHTATLTIKTGDITKEIALSGKVLAPGKWVLVKDVATLSAGDEIIIAAANADYAIGEAASNNYKGAAITKVGETANADAGVTVLKVEATGVAEAPYALKDGSKYLYAAGPSNNYLKAQATNNVNGQWAVTITAEGVASIVATKSENRNVMQFNPNNGSPIFACYASASQSALAIYRNSENVVKPVISGDADFTGSTQVTITAQSGLTVYYTTDGSDPDNTSTQYTAPFTINATTTVKAIAYDASSNASGVAEMTFTKHDLVDVATAMALAKDKIAYFAEFEVVKVVTGKGNIYIKDASGHGLIYDNTLAGQLKDGDRVQGFVGISSPYNGLPEAKPVDGLKVADLTITSGVAAEPYDFTSTAIAEADINKYVVFNDVEIATAVSMSNSKKEFSLTINGSNVVFYNQFSIEKTLEADKTYDIYGFVSIYNEKLQVYFYQALEEDEVVTKYTVTYNAGGATGEVPVDNNEYTEGAQVYLKSATGLTKEGYDYKGWKVTDESGNEITVSSNKFNMPASNVTVTAQWEEIVVPEIQDFSNGYWVLVTAANEIADGDKIVIAAADENFAMKSYESGNNCKQVAVTKLGDNRFLKWTSEIGVFQLAANGTIQDVNTEQYLYAAGTGSNNYLKAADEVPTDAEAAKPYIWTISYTDGVATVKATSDNRNTLMYNTGSDLFACYASGQKDIALYKHVDNIDPTLVTPSVESGIFSVGNNKYVQFSTGNLQYEVGTNTWSFAEKQYEVIGGEAYTGSNNTNYGMNVPGYTGKLDLFAWSSDGKFGVNPSNTDDDYGYAADNFVDWGKLVDGEDNWYTLTQNEMNYILNRTKDGKKLWALATVNDLVGLILLPDNWDTNINLVYGYIPEKFVYTKNLLSIAEWQTLEEAGAVFLPAGGSRTGGYGNTDKAGGKGTIDANGHYFHVDNVNIYGYYWLNTQDPRETHKNCASFLILPGWDEGPTVDEEGLDDLSTRPQVWSREKRRGNSVRLVKEVKPDYTREGQGAGVYGTVCYPKNIIWADGATLYEVAGKEGNKVIFDEVTTPEAGMPYIFIADQEVINFFCGTEEAAIAGEKNSLQGTFTQIDPAAENALTGNYVLYNNIIKKCGANCGLEANRAYFVADELENSLGAPTASQAPGRRRISLDVQSENTTTGLDNITNGENTTIKTIENGQLIIIRNGEKFNAQGVRF